MAQKDSRRLYMVLLYLYPDLENGYEKDYYLQNDSDGTGTFIVWRNTEIPEPTEQELANAKEDAVNDSWWKRLRRKRNKLLVDSDWTQGADIPSDLKSSYVDYRTDLRDLPTTVTKPDFDTLDNQSVNKWTENINSLMPTKPTG
jgi:hypothetical protein